MNTEESKRARSSSSLNRQHKGQSSKKQVALSAEERKGGAQKKPPRKDLTHRPPRARSALELFSQAYSAESKEDLSV